MKSLILAIGLACCQVTSVKADLAILYPVGSESFPGNGKQTILWTNSNNLGVTLYLDWYDTNNTLVTSDYVLYSTILSSGTNSFVLDSPSRFPTNYQYKVRLVGTNSSVNITSNSGLVKITDPASLVGQLTNQNPWLPGQNRNVTVSWSGFQSNDTYSLILESPTLNRADYGFLITNLVMGSGSGTQSFTIPYPINPVAAYPPASHDLIDGTHSFVLINPRCEITQPFGSIDMVTVGLRMYLSSVGTSYILKGESNECASIILDATLATNNVVATNLAYVFTSYSTNTLSLRFTLNDGSQVISTNSLTLNSSTNDQYHTKIDFPMNLTITAGQVKELEILCEVLVGSGIGSFIWTTEEVSSLIQADVGAKYSSGAGIVTAIIPSSGSYIDVIEVIQPKFFMTSMQSNSMSFGMLCKPLTYYVLQSSTNLTSWTDVLTTNSVTDNLFLSIPIEGGNKFFRLKEQ